MKPNELRIGNYLNWESSTLNKGIGQVEFINSRDSSPYMKTFQLDSGAISNQCSPIPLTEEWLVKLGFKYRNESRGFGAILDYKNPNFEYRTDNWKFNKSVAIVHVEGDESDVYYTVLTNPTAYKIKYVHQLQNLYFALTGEELTTSSE